MKSPGALVPSVRLIGSWDTGLSLTQSIALISHCEASHCHCPYFKGEETEAYRGKRFCLKSLPCVEMGFTLRTGLLQSWCSFSLPPCLLRFNLSSAFITSPNLSPCLSTAGQDSLVVLCLVYLHNLLGQGFESDWGRVLLPHLPAG